MIGHSVTSDGGHNNDHRIQGKEVKDSRRSDIIQYKHQILISCLTHGHLG